jgi:hypothetical protein
MPPLLMRLPLLGAVREALLRLLVSTAVAVTMLRTAHQQQQQQLVSCGGRTGQLASSKAIMSSRHRASTHTNV